jgi:hypothetical protein
MESASLSRLDCLTRLGLRDGVDMRPTLLRVLTDLYVQKPAHTPDEELHYTELALRLLDAVDIGTRRAVAESLAQYPSPPLPVIERLARDLADAASVPSRPNRQQREPVAESHGPIDSGVATELNELFLAADAQERKLILLNLEIIAPLPAGSVTLPRDAAIGERLEAAALSRNRETFAQHLAQALQISWAQADRLADDELGEPIVTAAKALNIRREVLYRILLFANVAIGHSVERVHALASLFDELTVPEAEHMVAIWQALPNTARPVERHQPLFWDDDARSRARAAKPADRHAPAAQPPAAPQPAARRDAF